MSSLPEYLATKRQPLSEFASDLYEMRFRPEQFLPVGASFSDEQNPLGEVRIQPFSIAITGFRAFRAGSRLVVEIMSETTERNSGAANRFTFTKSFLWAEWLIPGFPARALRIALGEWLLHEADERIYDGDARVFDPHVRGARPFASRLGMSDGTDAFVQEPITPERIG